MLLAKRPDHWIDAELNEGCQTMAMDSHAARRGLQIGHWTEAGDCGLETVDCGSTLDAGAGHGALDAERWRGLVACGIRSII